MNLKKFKLPHNVAAEGTNIEANKCYLKGIETILNILGINVINPSGLKITAQLMMLIFMTHTVVLSFLFMLFTDAPISEKLEATCLVCAIYQGIHKLYSAILYPGKYLKLSRVLHKLHVMYCNDHVIGPVLKKICVNSTIIFELIAIIFFCVALSYTILPIFLWKKYDLVTTIFPSHLPFIDWVTPFGYTINTVVHLYCLWIGVIGLVAGDTTFLYFVVHSIGYLQIFKNRVSKLDEVLESESQDLQKIQKQFCECVQAHQDYISYIESVDDIYSQLCMAQLVTSELGLILSLLLTFWRKWIVGPFISACALCQLLQYCLLGTVVTVQNDRASDIIYGMKWYLLPVHLQKLVVLMILRGQHPAELNASKFAKLNLATYMQLIKSTYTYVMMMLEFLP